MTEMAKNRAFTLIELLAVAAVIALAAAGTTTLLMRGNRKAAVMRYGQELALAARAARIYAVGHRQPCRLVLEQEGRRFYLKAQSEESSAAEEQTVLSLPYSRPVQMPESIGFEKIGIVEQEEGLTEIEFRPNGSARTALIQIGDGTHHVTVTILEGTGRVSVTDGQVSALTVDRVDLDEIEPVY